MTTNLINATRQMRIARRNNQISLAAQQRALRRLGHPALVQQAEESKVSALKWAGMMVLLESIHAEVAPRIERLRAAEANEFPKCFTMPAQTGSIAPRTVPALVGHEFTPEWWREAGEREAAEKKVKFDEAYGE